MRDLRARSSPWKLVKNRSLPLLVSLIAMIALHPLLLDEGFISVDALPLLILMVPLLGVAAIGGWRRAIPLVLLFVAITGWAYFGCGWDPVTVARSNIPFLVAAYYAYAIIALSLQLLRKAALEDDRIYGGLAIYLLIAMMFTTIHRHISLVDPTAYIETTNGTAVPFLWNDALYFSVSSITTLGFGDIVPRSSWARAATIAEVILGVFVTVIFVAQLVAASVHHAMTRGRSSEDSATH